MATKTATGLKKFDKVQLRQLRESIDEALKDLEQHPHIIEVQSGGGFVEEEQGRSRVEGRGSSARIGG